MFDVSLAIMIHTVQWQVLDALVLLEAPYLSINAYPMRVP